jgi:hypothetical protein
VTNTNTELGHDPIRLMPLARLHPSPENDQLYKPVSLRDPDLRELAVSIRRHGLREPLVITLDNYILSGHRRYAACKLAKLTSVPCRVENIYHGDPGFVALLREHNRQRVKSMDEVVREEIVSADPEEAHRVLVEHRKRKAEVSVETIQLKEPKRRARITAAKQPFLDAINRVLDERQDYWPLTDRQIHYALLNDPPLIHSSEPASRYTNTPEAYKSLTELLTRARLAGEIPFEVIHDPTRPVETWNVYREVSEFIRDELDGFLKGYYRDLQQSQPNHIEIIGEKNTIDNIVRPVAMEYCIPMTTGRGYCSLPPRRAMWQRFRRGGKEKLILLALTDFDPEGEDIAETYARSMRDDFNIQAILPIKAMLTYRQVTEMNLSTKMKAKEKSSRRKAFVERYGDNVFELEAVPPDRMQEILRDAIDQVLDIDAFNAEVDAEKQDAAKLDSIRLQMAGRVEFLRPSDEDAPEGG